MLQSSGCIDCESYPVSHCEPAQAESVKVVPNGSANVAHGDEAVPGTHITFEHSMIAKSIHSAWLFPGQGSQSVGMGAKLLKEFPRAARILRTAEEISHQPLVQAMTRGPESQLTRSEVVQPAIVALSCGYIDLLNETGMHPDFVAGHSLGELSALYAARVLDLEQTLRLASERGRLMSLGATGGMIAVKDCELSKLESLVDDVHEGTVCIANLNARSQIVISGDDAGLESLAAKIKSAGGQSVRLNVAGAWHSPLVAVAACEFEKELLRTSFAEPQCQVVMSSTASLVDKASGIKQQMLKQMTSSVRWFETIELLFNQSVTQFYEVGSGKVLKGLMRRILADENSYEIHGMEAGTLWTNVIGHWRKASSPSVDQKSTSSMPGNESTV